MDDRAWEAFKIEYSSLRDESLHTSQVQQAVLQWSMGATAVLFAGVMALAGESDTSSSSLRVFMLGFAIPGFVVASSLAWASELVRKERIGLFLRVRERALWSPEDRERSSVEIAHVAEAARFPLVWENFISFSRAGLGEKRASFGYFGAISIYFGATVTSLVLFSQELLSHDFHAHGWGFRRAGVAYAVTVTAVYLSFFVYFGISLLKRSRRLVSPPDGGRPRRGSFRP